MFYFSNRAIALLSLRITPLFKIVTIATLYAVAFVIYVVYTQSIVSDISSNSLILLSSLPLISGITETRVKPRRFTKLEQSQFVLSF